MATDAALARLSGVLESTAPAAVAVSGGVDSMTLAFVAARVLGAQVRMFHAVSPAVPPLATARVERYAAAENWPLTVLDAGEFADPHYLANPANRCFFCKSNLYAALAAHTNAQLLSGTNVDDLGDWRPGLEAARTHGVRHPFVEADIDKACVRTLARTLGLMDVAELPAAPCLSSRVETGIAIDALALAFIDAAEQALRSALAPQTVRVRWRRHALVVELDAMTLAALDHEQREIMLTNLARLAGAPSHGRIEFAHYVRGSAFLR